MHRSTRSVEATRRRRLTVGVACAAVALLVLSGLIGLAVRRTASDEAASSPVPWAAGLPAGAFTTAVTATHSDRCWSVDGVTGAVTQQDCSGAPSQVLAFVPAGEHYTVRSGASTCLGTSDGLAVDNAVLRAVPCAATSTVVDLQPVSDQPGSYRLMVGTAHCADVLGGETVAGVPVGLFACADVSTAGNQIFRMSVPATGVVTLPAVSGGASSAAAALLAAQTAAGSTGAAVTGPAAAGPVATGPARPADVIKAGLVGKAPFWGKATPPKGAVLSRAYRLAVANTPKGYQPHSAECSAAVHARYWSWGPDGKVYPTWHPVRDRSGCSFGHDHGDDPRTSRLFASVGWPPFGYTNEQLAPSNPASQRDEDHVGHKVTVLNNVATHPGNDVQRPASRRCDAYVKFHQGTHSPDALASNLHELFYNVRCTNLDDGSISEGHIMALRPIGMPGSFNSSNTCDGTGNTVHQHVAAPVPADSIPGGGLRKIPDADCAAKVLAGDGDISRFVELWTIELHVGGQGGLQRLDLDPYAHVYNPARYYDPSSSTKIGRTIDLCYRGAKGADCDTVRAITARTGRKVAWDSPDSPFNGARRRLNPNYFSVVNTGPSTLYSDVFGERWSATPFPGAIRQYAKGTHRDSADIGDIFVGGDVGLHEVNYARNRADRVRAPN